MTYGTVMLMKKNDTFITQAMLSSYMAVETKDYLELILPFVCMCLPEKRDDIIELEKIQNVLKNKFGLDIPVNVVEKLLLRLCKQKRGAVVKKIPSGYVVNSIYNADEFENRTIKIKKSIDAVISKMQKYMHKEKYIKDISSDKMREYLAVFLDTYNYSVFDDTKNLDTITLDKNSESNYYVAQFILSEYENDTVEFQDILEIIKGSLIAKSIYYFMDSENDITKKRIKGTRFILDTRVLIDVLGEQRKTSKLKQDTEIIIDNLEKKRNAMSKEKEEYEKKIEYVKKKQKEIIQKARNKANMIKGITKILIYVVLLVIFLGITALFAIGTWKISDLTKVSLVWSYVYVGVVSIICLVITIISIIKWLIK